MERIAKSGPKHETDLRKTDSVVALGGSYADAAGIADSAVVVVAAVAVAVAVEELDASWPTSFADAMVVGVLVVVRCA